MTGLIIIALLAVISGPLLAMIALFRMSDQDRRISRLRDEVNKLSELLSQRPLATATASIQPDETVSVKVEPEPVAKEATTDAPPVSDGPAKETDAQTPETEPSRPVKTWEGSLASRWFVWLGGIAIALGGLLLVKYAHDNGLVPPIVRVIFGLMAAGALVAAGEWLRRKQGEAIKSYVPAAVSAAGLVIAFGVLYAAYALYELISPAVCFPALVAIGLGALFLSRRQGPLIAALGLLGSYVAPMLVPSENPSAIGFFAYLLVIVVASLFELRRNTWWWLGYAAIGGAFIWSLLWISAGFFGPSSFWPTGLFALALGAAATVLPRGREILDSEMGSLLDPKNMTPPMGIATAGIAAGALILASLTLNSQHALLSLLMFAVGLAAITAFGWLRDGLVAAPLAAALLCFFTLLGWSDVGFHSWAMDENGLWSTVPGQIEPPRYKWTMLIAGAAFSAIGLAGVMRKRETRPWAALASGAAVLFLFFAWARADFNWDNASWAITGVIFAAALAVVTWHIWPKLRQDNAQAMSTEILFGGITLLLLFVLDRLLDGLWLTLSMAVLVAALAYATHSFTRPLIAAIACVVATLVAVRLFLGREFWGDPSGVPLGAHWALYGYGVPALLFWQAARWLKDREGYERWRFALEGLSLGLAISLIALELRVLIAGDITADRFSLLEVAANGLAWLGAAYGLAYRQQLYSSFVSLWGSRVLLAGAGLAFLVALTTKNPVISSETVQGGQLFNSLWLAYLAPVPLIALVARKLDGLGLGQLRNAVGLFALVLLMAFVTLIIKRQFQGAILDLEFLSQPESYTTSVGWLLTGLAIFVAGLKLNRQNIRYGGLAILVLTILKVFALDLFALGGLWRIASIIGLGVCLVGVGWLYTKFMQKKESVPA